MTNTLWPHQATAIDRLRASLRAGKKRPILQAPTGYGKTRVAAEIIAMAREKGRRVTFMVPRLALIGQTVRAFLAEGIDDLGVIQRQHELTNPSASVQIASAQTLVRREFPDTDLVICDECHQHMAVYTKWMAKEPNLPWVGLSATPWTKGLGKFYDDLIISATTRSLIHQQYLSPFIVFAPAHPDLSGVGIIAGDYRENELAEVMNEEGLVGDIVSTWQEKAENRPTLVFAVDRAHAYHLMVRFQDAGVSAAYQDAFTSDFERERIRVGFARGEISVVCNVGTLTTGVDWDVRCIVLARPTRSEILFCQIVGRGLRRAEGKTNLMILDHSDNHARLGFVTDIHHETLDTGESRKAREPAKKAALKECIKCGCLMALKELVCPACGFVHGHDVTPVRGGQLAMAGMDVDMVLVNGHRLHRRELYAQLKTYQEANDYRAGWTAHKFRSATGDWPPRGWENIKKQPLATPIYLWIRRELVRFAKEAPVREPAVATG